MACASLVSGERDDGYQLSCVSGAKLCRDQLAWYFEPGTERATDIVGCPATCAVLEDQEEARVELLLGCETVQTGIRW